MSKLIAIISVAGLLLAMFGCQTAVVPPAPVQYVPSPWAGFGEDSFVQYKKFLTGGDFVEERLTVVDVRANQVTALLTVKDGEDWTAKRRLVLPLKMAEAPADRKPETSEETLAIGGKSVVCTVLKEYVPDPQNTDKKILAQTWKSNEVFGGTVRITYDHKMAMEVVDFEKK